MKPLSSITTEHLYAIARIFHQDSENDYWYIREMNDNFVILECKVYRMWVHFDDDFISVEERYEGKENQEAHGGEAETTSIGIAIVDIIDFLRLHDYELPNKHPKVPVETIDWDGMYNMIAEEAQGVDKYCYGLPNMSPEKDYIIQQMKTFVTK